MRWPWESDSEETLVVSEELQTNETGIDCATNPFEQGIRGALDNISGGYDFSDTQHNVYLDYGYPGEISFSQAWNMYRRLGIAKNLVELKPDAGWAVDPTIESEDKKFLSAFEKLVKDHDFWQRMKALDTRQRVGQYAGLFMRVKDDKLLDQEMDSTGLEITSLEDMIPLYEGQLKVLEIENEIKSPNFGMPKSYQFNSRGVGGTNPKASISTTIHPSRIVIAAEGSDNGGIYGVSVLEAPFNSLMDVRKTMGGGAEGFYRNAAQRVIFEVTDEKIAKAAGTTLIAKLSKAFDTFIHSPFRRAFTATGLKPTILTSQLESPKDFFMVSVQDIAASEQIPATILIGQQTGRLASEEDSRAFKSQVKSRQLNWQTEMLRDVIGWLMNAGILPTAEYEIEWDDILALSDKEQLENADKMAGVNEKQFKSGGQPVFSPEEMREAAGMDPEEVLDLPDESELDEDAFGEDDDILSAVK